MAIVTLEMGDIIHELSDGIGAVVDSSHVVVVRQPLHKSGTHRITLETITPGFFPLTLQERMKLDYVTAAILSGVLVSLGKRSILAH